MSNKYVNKYRHLEIQYSEQQQSSGCLLEVALMNNISDVFGEQAEDRAERVRIPQEAE